MLAKSIKILVAGDSLALPRMGRDYISYKDVWPELLKNNLSNNFSEIRILNHSERARTITKLVKNFQDIVYIWEPDVLILQIGIVDCAPRLFSEKEHGFLNSGLIHWRIAKIIINLFSKYRRVIIKLRPWVRYTPLKKFKINLLLLGELLKKTNIKVIVLPIMPTFPSHAYRSPGYNESVQAYNLEWEKWCQLFSHAIIKTEEIILNENLEEMLLKDGHHLSIKGHKIFSNVIADKIIKIYEK